MAMNKANALSTALTEGRDSKDIALLALEQMAAAADNKVHDELLKELVFKYAEAERELARLNQLKNIFLGMAAHDLRNPIASIRGFSELMLADEEQGEENEELISMIYEASKETLQMLNDLLDISHIESNKFNLSKENHNLSKLARERIARSKDQAAKKDIRINSSIAADLFLLCDRQRIAQAMDNFLSNAIKYSPPGAEVEALLEVRDEYIQFEVQDQGPGIDEDSQKKLFKEFSKVGTQPTAGEKSTGLGLSIVKKIVEAHKGEIGVKSTPGKGSSFYFRILVQD